MRSPDPDSLEELRINLLNGTVHCVLTQLLVPPVQIALGDHDYIRNCEDENCTNSITNLSTICDQSQHCSQLDHYLQGLDKKSPAEEKSSLNVSPAERQEIERSTRCQSKASEWHSLRARRITGSKCGKILCQQSTTEALLRSILYSKPMDPKKLPAPIKWGIDNESHACEAYAQHMNTNGHKGLTTRPCGFVVHPTMGWLGATPDAFVNDPTYELSSGIAEFKCPYSVKDATPTEACQKPSFYCTMVNGKLHLKRQHSYYHQVQLQLYIGMDMYHWCDFCMCTMKGVAVERISLDIEWCNTNITELESYFDMYMLPEIVSSKLKPSYIY